MADTDIDIYGETDEFSHNSDEHIHNGVNVKPEALDSEDLFDTVLQSSNDDRAGSISDGASYGGQSYQMINRDRRNFIYVGNMNWWTTDQDLFDVIEGLGINDLVEIKFHENRQNGQSKGFAMVIFNSAASTSQALDRLPKMEIQGNQLIAMQYTKLNLLHLEDINRRNDPNPRRQREGGQGSQYGNNNNNRGDGIPPHQHQHPQQAVPQQQQLQHLGTVRIAPIMPQPMPSGPIRLPTVIAGAPHLQFPPGMRPPPGLGPPGVPVSAAGHFQFPPGLRPPPGPMPPSFVTALRGGSGPPPTSMPPPMPGMHGGFPPRHMIPPPAGAPAPHINPNFVPQTGHHAGQPPLMAMQGAQQQIHGSAGMVPPPHANDPPLSDAEFEEIMNRNKTVSSSAIARAVSDASAGDYASAIETLVTAISLIRQSRVANDDRCKILITALQDTLHGIEAKSYGRKERTRDRSRSRDRESRRKRHRSRSRSRSRDRYRDEFSPTRTAGRPRHY